MFVTENAFEIVVLYFQFTEDTIKMENTKTKKIKTLQNISRISVIDLDFMGFKAL